jgi:hypothetical protein
MSGSKQRSKSLGESQLVLEWTNQHGCGHGDLDCNIVLQYMCQDNRYENFNGANRLTDLDTIRNGMTDKLFDDVELDRSLRTIPLEL